MIKIFLLLFSVGVFAQTNYYVSNETKGTGDGLSWTNAKAAGYGVSGAFNWSTLQPGDTVFFDGGSDSLTYNWIYPYGFEGTAENPVVFTKGREANHNGGVWFTGRNTPDDGGNVNLIQIGANGYTTSYLTIDNINFQIDTSISYGSLALIAVSGLGHTIQNCNIYATANAIGKRINGTTTGNFISAGECTTLTLFNNHFEVREEYANDTTLWFDGMYMSGGDGGHIIDGNTWILRGLEPESHKDILQIGYLEGGTTQLDRPSITIRNNFLYGGSLTTEGMNCAIYGYSSASLTWNIYNNIIYWVGIGARIIDIGRDMYTNGTTANMRATVKMFNNTLYNGNSSGLGGQSMWFEGQRNNGIGVGSFCDTVIYKNNVLYDNTGGNAVFVLGSGADYDSIYKDFNYNRNYFPNMGSNPSRFLTANSGQDFSFTGWQTEGQDNNSSITLISFDDLGGFDLGDYFTVTGRDSGVDLSSYFTTDILGNERSGAWDIGALQFIDEGSADTVPSYSFTAVTDAELSTLYEGTAVFSGADSTFTVYTSTSAEFKIGALDTYNTDSKTAESGDTVYVRNTSSGSYSTLSRETIIAGGVSRNFDVTTKSAPVIEVRRAVTSEGKQLRTSSGKRIMLRTE